MCDCSHQYTNRIISLLERLSLDDIYVRIIVSIARSENGCLSLRGLSRAVSMSPKNVKKYVTRLERLGLLRVEHPHEKLILIYLNYSIDWIRGFLSK
ncbi:MAG: winged helix-turn-helix transcriptional regulator [Crenarchaeota archaeon]|nr:winged helix-turn-helix transcriptional regulator [Thermoproteota archaeon]